MLNNKSSRYVRGPSSILEAGPAGNRRRECRYYGVAGARYVVNLSGHRRQSERLRSVSEKRHSLFAAGDQHGLELMVTDKFTAGAFYAIGFTVFESAGFSCLAAIRCDQVGTGIFRVILSFGIDQY